MKGPIPNHWLHSTPNLERRNQKKKKKKLDAVMHWLNELVIYCVYINVFPRGMTKKNILMKIRKRNKRQRKKKHINIEDGRKSIVKSVISDNKKVTIRAIIKRKSNIGKADEESKIKFTTRKYNF